MPRIRSFLPRAGCTLAMAALLTWNLPIAAADQRVADSPTALSVSTASVRNLLAPIAVRQFYAARANQAAWSEDSDFDALLLAIAGLADHGLNPDHYRIEQLTALRNDRIARDVVATDAWFSAAAHLVDGKVDPVSVEPDWSAARRSVDLKARLTQSLVGHSIGDSLSGLAPAQPGYARLVSALRQLRADSELVDTPSEARAIRQRIDQLRVNLERWRWLPDDLGQRHIRANIADFKLEAWENGEVARTHRIIVGKLYRKTPVFSSAIQYLVLNPWWETPPRLARVDKLKAFRKDPTAVRRLGFTVLDREGQRVDPSNIDWHAVNPASFPYRLRQAPGEQNALGKIKIIFPNRHNVYLHDTPSRELFEETTRTFSSGCLRTENPVELAKWLLQDTDGWTDGDKLDSAVASGRLQNINLARTIPVHVLYFTAVSADDGSVRFLSDVYDRDARVLAALTTTPERSRQRAAQI